MNTDTSIYKALEVLKTGLKNAGFKHISFGTVTEVDLNEQNIYPLCHINLVNCQVTRGFWKVGFNLDVLDIIDDPNENPATTLAPFSLTTNEPDIFNDLAYRVYKSVQEIYKNEPQIEDIQVPQMTAYYTTAQNKLCGYAIKNLIITVPPVC